MKTYFALHRRPRGNACDPACICFAVVESNAISDIVLFLYISRLSEKRFEAHGPKALKLNAHVSSLVVNFRPCAVAFLVDPLPATVLVISYKTRKMREFLLLVIVIYRADTQLALNWDLKVVYSLRS